MESHVVGDPEGRWLILIAIYDHPTSPHGFAGRRSLDVSQSTPIAAAFAAIPLTSLDDDLPAFQIRAVEGFDCSLPSGFRRDGHECESSLVAGIPVNRHMEVDYLPVFGKCRSEQVLIDFSGEPSDE